MHPRFFYCSFACNFPPFCFCHVVRRCEERFEPQEVLERIWNDSGEEEDLDSDETSESEVESSELTSEDESDESVDSFYRMNEMMFKILNKTAVMKLLMAEMVGIG